jgi:hypothetical protein
MINKVVQFKQNLGTEVSQLFQNFLLIKRAAGITAKTISTYQQHFYTINLYYSLNNMYMEDITVPLAWGFWASLHFNK